MKFQDYSDLAQRTDNKELTYEHRVINYTMGLAGEAGEVANKVKKALFHPHKPATKAQVLDEMGDVLWYLDALSRALGSSLEEIAQNNIAKLKARHPDGFPGGKGGLK